MFRPIWTLAIVLAVVSAHPAYAYRSLPRALASMSPADFARSVRITDDAHGAATVLSTSEGYTRARSIQGARADDVHLRASVDRATGRVTWHVIHDLITIRGHRKISVIEYVAGGERRVVRPSAIDYRLDHCPPTDGIGSCNPFTRIGFELPEHTVQEIANSYRAGSREPWRVYFRDKSGNAIVGGIAPAEAAGLIQALDAWRGGMTAWTSIEAVTPSNYLL